MTLRTWLSVYPHSSFKWKMRSTAAVLHSVLNQGRMLAGESYTTQWIKHTPFLVYTCLEGANHKMLVKTRRGSFLTGEYCELTFPVFKVHLKWNLKCSMIREEVKAVRYLASKERKEREMLSTGQWAEYLWKPYIQLRNIEDDLKGYCKLKFSVLNNL